jgi:hypothetical protein
MWTRAPSRKIARERVTYPHTRSIADTTVIVP